MECYHSKIHGSTKCRSRTCFPSLTLLALLSVVSFKTRAQDHILSLSPATIAHRAAAFTTEVESRYQELSAQDSIKGDNDVTAIALKSFTVGMRFDDAEGILRAAGCAVSGRHHGELPPTPLDDQMWVAKVSGICKITAGFWHNGTELVVLLYPITPSNYSIVGNIRASIVVQSF